MTFLRTCMLIFTFSLLSLLQFTCFTMFLRTCMLSGTCLWTSFDDTREADAAQKDLWARCRQDFWDTGAQFTVFTGFTDFTGFTGTVTVSVCTCLRSSPQACQVQKCTRSSVCSLHITSLALSSRNVMTVGSQICVVNTYDMYVYSTLSLESLGHGR